MYERTVEIFDLSKLPPERTEFTVGDAAPVDNGCFVGDKYIDITVKPVVIDRTYCICCGNCCEVCPAGAIIKKG